MIENRFKYLGYRSKTDDIEDWKCFEMDCEGHLVSINSSNFHLSNESIEHLSNFPHLRKFKIIIKQLPEEQVINFSILSNLRKLEITFERFEKDPELLQDLGLFSNLLCLCLENHSSSNYDIFSNPQFMNCFRFIFIASFHFQFIQFGFSLFDKLHCSRF